jgi:CheY-like chemotaxis protein
MASQGNILIIEDEPGPALALKMILKPYYQVYSAERGEAALEILKTSADRRRIAGPPHAGPLRDAVAREDQGATTLTSR